jgi:NitT/TauT family transport system permease protein
MTLFRSERMPWVIVARLATIIFIFGVWEILSRTGIVSPQLLPAPSKVWAAVQALFADGKIYADIGITMFSIGVAVLIAMPFGVIVGFLLQESAYWGTVVKPLVFFPLSIPKSVFLPIFIFIFGIGVSMKIGFAVFSIIFLVILATTTAIEAVNPDHLTVARSYGATRLQIAWRVYLPSMLPIMLDGVRVSVIFAFTGVVLAEMYASRAGMGYLIASWGDNFMVDKLLAGIFLVSTAAIVINESIRWLEVQCSRWRE